MRKMAATTCSVVSNPAPIPTSAVTCFWFLMREFWYMFLFFPKHFPPFLINYFYLETLFHFSWSSFFLSTISWFQEISWKVASLTKIYGFDLRWVDCIWWFERTQEKYKLSNIYLLLFYFQRVRRRERHRRDPCPRSVFVACRIWVRRLERLHRSSPPCLHVCAMKEKN